ncbi:hypothetical protein, partial [Streptomyces tateyamensis]
MAQRAVPTRASWGAFSPLAEHSRTPERALVVQEDKDRTDRLRARRRRTSAPTWGAPAGTAFW